MPRRPTADSFARNPSRLQKALIQYLLDHRLTVNGWATASGLGESTLRMALKKDGATITYGTLQKLATGEGKEVKDILGFDVNPPALLVGKVGAGAVVRLFDGDTSQGEQEEVEAPVGIDNSGDLQCLEIEGDSMHPFRNGWRVFFRMVHDGVTDNEIGHLCVIKLADGHMYLKELYRGSAPGRFTLQSWNAPPMIDQIVATAALVLAIVPS